MHETIQKLLFSTLKPKITNEKIGLWTPIYVISRLNFWVTSALDIRYLWNF